MTSSASSSDSRRQQPGQALGEHRLARAGRTEQQRVVAAGGDHLDRRASGDLADDVGEVGLRQRQASAPPAGRLVVGLAGEQQHQVAQRADPAGA